MKCQDVKVELTAYLNDELEPYKKIAIEQHLQNCSSCALELVRLQKTIASLKENLEQTCSEQHGALGAWVKEQAANLSEGDIAERRKWVASLEQNPHSVQTTKQIKHRFFALTRLRSAAACIILAVMLFAYWPQVVSASTKLPLVGDWIRQLVLQDSGLTWAYENGYMVESPLFVEQDGVKLTILGWVADPIQTTVIYLVEGMPSDQNVYVTIPEVDGEGTTSWHNPAQKTPLGYVGLSHTNAVPEGNHNLTVTLVKSGNLARNLELTLPVTREAISKLSQSTQLQYEKTVNGITLKANRVVYTPTQVRVDYQVIGGGGVIGTLTPDQEIYLMTADGKKIVSRSGHGTGRDNVWDYYQVFDRPESTKGLTMVVPMLSRYETVQFDLTALDVGKKQTLLGQPLELRSWDKNVETLNLEFFFPTKSALKGLGKWMVEDREISVPQTGYQGPLQDGSIVQYALNVEGSSPLAVIATEAQILVKGNWQIPLNAAK